MRITLDVPDSLERNRAIEGSLFLSEGRIGNFRPYNRQPRKRKKFRKLEHGKVSYGDEKTTFYLSISHEEGINEPDAVFDEAWKAKMWLEEFSCK